MKITLSTTNPTKIVQIKPIFAGLPVEIRTLAEAGIEGEAVEDGATLEENARKKAWFAFERSPKGTWAMADDTGIMISALDGAPGVHSARWAGDVSTEEITAHTLRLMEGKTDRSAVFRTVAALISPDGILTMFQGEVAGRILEKPRTLPQPKMPYSGIFEADGTGKVWAEMTTAEENAISHRGRAFMAVRRFLEERAV